VDWATYVTALTLNRLARRDIETVIDNVVGNKLIPANIRQDIVERTCAGQMAIGL